MYTLSGQAPSSVAEAAGFSKPRGVTASPVYVAVGFGSIDERWLRYFLDRAVDVRCGGVGR